MLGIIGGSGLTQLSNLEITRREVVRTPYGEPSGALTFCALDGHEVVFLARHGYGHTIPPHAVNYRANIWAMHAQGVSELASIASVGGIRADLQPGVLAGEAAAAGHVDDQQRLAGPFPKLALATLEALLPGMQNAGANDPSTYLTSVFLHFFCQLR